MLNKKKLLWRHFSMMIIITLFRLFRYNEREFNRHKKAAIMLNHFLLAFRILKQKLKIFFRLEDISFQSYIYVFKFSDFVMTLQGNHENHFLFSMNGGYLHTKFEVFSINLFQVMEGDLKGSPPPPIFESHKRSNLNRVNALIACCIRFISSQNESCEINLNYFIKTWLV